MSLNRKIFERQIRCILRWAELESGLVLLSDSAVNLLLGTAAQESAFGKYTRQLGGGPAVGVFQMEPKTFDWLSAKYAKKFKWLADCVADEMADDICLAIIMCRLRYYVDPLPLLAADDIEGLAKAWKKIYNSELGKGKPEQFIENYNLYVSKGA